MLDQGNLTRSTANCFVYQTTADITTYSGTQSFDYYYFDNPDPTNCEYPESPVGFDNNPSNSLGSCCNNNIGTVNITGGGGNIPFELLPPLHPDNVDPCNDCVRDNIDHRVDVIINTGGDIPLTYYYQSQLDYTSDQMLEDWINYGLYVAMQSGDLSTGVQILTPLNKWKWKIRLYGLYVWFQEYDLINLEILLIPNLPLMPAKITISKKAAYENFTPCFLLTSGISLNRL